MDASEPNSQPSEDLSATSSQLAQRARDEYNAAEAEAFETLFLDIEQVRDELRAHARTLQQLIAQPTLTELLSVAERVLATKTALSAATSRYFESTNAALDALLAARAHRRGQPGLNQAR